MLQRECISALDTPLDLISVIYVEIHAGVLVHPVGVAVSYSSRFRSAHNQLAREAFSLSCQFEL